MNYKILVAGVLLIPLLIACLSGCLGDDDGGYSQAEIRYTIKMTNATSEERYVLLPVPRLRVESASKLTDGLRITGGSGGIEIVDDTYGKCIKITFTDEIVVHFSGRLNDSSDLDFYYFTMVSGYEEDSISRVK